MKTEVKVLAATLVFSLIMLFGAVFFLSKNQTAPQATNDDQTYEIDYSKGQKVGSDSAKVKLVEFSDLQCPACKAYESQVKQVLEKDGENIQFIYKHFPLPQHLNARVAANFAEYAASQGKFWEVKDKLFETQERWAAEKDPTASFVEIGKEFGLDEAGIKDALGKSLFNQAINEQMDEGKKVNVNATPTFYLNGKQLQLQNFSDLSLVVEQALNEN